MNQAPNGPFYLGPQPAPNDRRKRNAFGILVGFGKASTRWWKRKQREKKVPTIVKFCSHRANEKLTQLIGNTQEYYCWENGNHWKECPPEHLEEALKIKGVKKAKWNDKMRPCIKWT